MCFAYAAKLKVNLKCAIYVHLRVASIKGPEAKLMCIP